MMIWRDCICVRVYAASLLTKLILEGAKAMGVTIAYWSMQITSFVLMDIPGGDGTEALVILDKEDMGIFKDDNEMLSFCQINSS